MTSRWQGERGQRGGGGGGPDQMERPCRSGDKRKEGGGGGGGGGERGGMRPRVWTTRRLVASASRAARAPGSRVVVCLLSSSP